MYPNYYPYDDDDDDNNNNNNNNNNDNDKKAWSAGRWGEGGENRVWDLGEPGKLTRAPLTCVASVSNRVSFCFCSHDELAGNACHAGYAPWKTDFDG